MPYNTYGNYNSRYLQEGNPVGLTPLEVSLVADNTNVDVSNYQMVKITSDNTTAANRTFTVTDGIVVGHQLFLTLVSAGSTTAQLADSGNVALSAAWEPLVDDVLQLVWQGSKWVEVSRADN